MRKRGLRVLCVLAKSLLSYIIPSPLTVLVNMCFLNSLISFESDAIFPLCYFLLKYGNLPSFELVYFPLHTFFVNCYLMHTNIFSDYKNKIHPRVG